MENEENEVKQEIKKYADLAFLANSDGGKILIEALKKDIVSAIEDLRYKHNDLSHTQLLALCIKLNERLNILQVLKNAEENREVAVKELNDILMAKE